MKDEQVVGFSPEMLDKLSRLLDQVQFLLDYPTPSIKHGLPTSWTNLSERYDIIIGDFGIKDLSNSVLPTSVLPAPKQIGNASSLPGTDQWPNVARDPVLSNVDALALKWIEEYGIILSHQEEVVAASAFRAGFKEGMKADAALNKPCNPGPK